MKPNSSLPYELYAHSHGAFVCFEQGETVALPLLALAKATLRGADDSFLALDFGSALVEVEGRRLGELLAQLLLGRVRVIRCGQNEECRVERIQLSEL